VATTKTGRGRTVDLSRQVLNVLRRLETKPKAEALRRGWGEVPPWLFVNTVGQPLDPVRVRKVMARALRAAGLPGHLTPHCLRHTFASQLLQAGESPAYVQRQLGHASIKLTVDTYGEWLPMGNPTAVDRLDDDAADPGPGVGPAQVVAKSVAADASAPSLPSQNPASTAESPGEPSGTRTLDPLIKSAAVCGGFRDALLRPRQFGSRRLRVGVVGHEASRCEE
jgi:integrase